MAKIRSVGAGVRSSGKVDGLVYVHTKGKTYARALPIMPASMFKTPAARKRQALFCSAVKSISRCPRYPDCPVMAELNDTMPPASK